MNAVAYCRVSTNKNEQIDSMAAQQKFFAEYAMRNGLKLIHIYADEGKSGTKIHNRTQLLKLLSDAGNKTFQIVLIKDVSRLARNTVDFLTSIRNLKHLGIKVVFVNYDQTSSESSEFMLTMLSAIAQEESANTSKRVKFGKKLNAEKGRVPNLVFGYDKIPGDFFKLNINKEEAEIVVRIFQMYTDENMGTAKIANKLNEMHICTKRGHKWTQTGVNRILTNPIYIGKIVNGKEEVADFLTGKRKANEMEKWDICINKDMAIIEESLFYKAETLMHARRKNKKERLTNKHIFSKKIKCMYCKASFRRYDRKKGINYIKWVCSTRNLKGKDACSNKISISEQILVENIKEYINVFLLDFNSFINDIVAAYEKEHNIISESEIQKQIKKLEKTKFKYITMFENDIIDVNELKNFTENINTEIKSLNKQTGMWGSELREQFFRSLQCYNKILEQIKIDYYFIDKLISKIEIWENGTAHVYIREI